MRRELIVIQTFSAAHFLEHYQGKCEHMHGHTFQVEIVLRADDLDASGISIDFHEIKAFLKNMLPDHSVLNDVYSFSPSAENLAQHFYQETAKIYPVVKVTVWESADAGAVYTED